MKRPGIFITFEGIDGCGKSTKAALLASHLESRGIEVVSLRDPGSTALSERVRRLLLDVSYVDMAPECELLLYEAARAQLVREVIMPALARGAVVICDRFLDSTLAYQAGGRGLPESMVCRANGLGCCGVVPDRTVVFDIDPAVAYGRVTSQAAPDRIEAEGMGFQRRVRAAYMRLARREPSRIKVVDGYGTVEEVYDRLVCALSDVLPVLGGGASVSTVLLTSSHASVQDLSDA